MRSHRGASHRRYAEGTYISPDGEVFPASVLFKRAAADPLTWACPGLSMPEPFEIPSYTGAGLDGDHAMDGYGQPMFLDQTDPAVMAVANHMAAAYWNQQQAAMQETAQPPASSHPAYNCVQRHTWRRQVCIFWACLSMHRLCAHSADLVHALPQVDRDRRHL